MRRREFLSSDPLQSALEAGLRYVGCEGPAIRRVRWGTGFRYLDPDGRGVRDPAALERIRSLAIPPAWTDVRICPSAEGHLQAVGRDARGRRQYRYHPLYRAVRDQAKFGRMIAFGCALSVVRRRVAEDLALPGLPKEKVLATVAALLDATSIRVGNDEYARDNESFGLTTMRDRHVRVEGARLLFRFRGKSGREQLVELTDRRLARNVQQCRDLPGYELFQYVDGRGEVCRVDSGDVNRYIQRIAGGLFSAKDFRTWAGTVLAVRELAALGAPPGRREAARRVTAAVRRVAVRLGNRPATCRKYYIHPAVIEAWERGALPAALEEGARQAEAYGGQGLTPEEYAAIATVAEHQEKLALEARRRRAAA